MSGRILITGGAGFIGSHLADELLAHGYRVRALDDLSAQVHGPARQRPGYLSPDVELVVGDVRDPGAVRKALDGVDAVYHLAARVGVGQSMYEIAELHRRQQPGHRGPARGADRAAGRAADRGLQHEHLRRGAVPRRRRPRWCTARERGRDQLRARRLGGARRPQGRPLTPLPTPETKTPSLSSVYALSKYDQERLCLMVGRAYGMPTVALRFFNVYGTRQALSNPYTGVLAIFAARLLNGNAPLLFEDGRQQARLRARLRRRPRLPAGARGGGRARPGAQHRQRPPVHRAGDRPCHGRGARPRAPRAGGHRQLPGGDIRHCFADITLARRILGFEPQVPFEQGLLELAAWLEGQVACDRVAEARAELASRGLTV